MKEIKRRVYKDCGRKMWRALVVNIISEGLDAVVVAVVVSYLGKFADIIINNDVQEEPFLFLKIIIGLIFLIVIVPLMDLLKNVLMLKGALAHDRCLYSRYLQMRYDKIREVEEGEVQYRLENDPIDLRYYWLEISTKCFVILGVLFFLASQCANINICYVLIVVAISVLRSIFPILLKKYEGKYDLEVREYESSNKALENEYFTNISFIKRHGLCEKYVEVIKSLFNNFFKTTKKKQVLYHSFCDKINEFMQKFSYILILLVGCFFVKNEIVVLSSVIAMMGYSSLFDRICNDVGFVIRKTPIMQNSCERISFFYVNEEEAKGEKYLPQEDINVKDLSFSYGDKAIFTKYSGKMYLNKKNAIVGGNGSGKTTLLKVIYGLEKEYGGAVLLDGISLENINIEHWRKHIGVAFQNPIVFEGSVKDNITMFSEDSDDAVVEALIYELELAKIADRMLVDNDSSISGGELQKISIARALIRRPDILFMDEPNNHLDSNAIEWLYEFIKNYTGSLVYIAHSKKFIDLADNVVIVGEDNFGQ